MDKMQATYLFLKMRNGAQDQFMTVWDLFVKGQQEVCYAFFISFMGFF